MKKEIINLNSVENMKNYNLDGKRKVCIDINEEAWNDENYYAWV
ncbi:hypothetical protein [Clostridium sp. UBA6640]|nr:hypothetical protein [Clostridium sp. UBA6640]